jgi:hypothetical protein
MNVDEPLNLVPDESGPSVPADGAAEGADSTKTSRFNPKFTDAVIAATGPKANARLAQVMPSLLRHLHDFARENEITVDEWTAAVEMVRCGEAFSSLSLFISRVFGRGSENATSWLFANLFCFFF